LTSACSDLYSQGIGQRRHNVPTIASRRIALYRESIWILGEALDNIRSEPWHKSALFVHRHVV
jgi:hypothetical protein